MPRLRSGLAAALVLIAVVAAACAAPPPSASPSPPRAGIHVAIPALGPGVQALPVTIVDHAGIVRDAGPGPVMTDVTSDTTVRAVPGVDDAVILTWLGGACDERVIVTIDPDGPQYRVTLRSDTAATTCPAVGIPRSLLLGLDEPRPAAAFYVLQ
jgi:hypothetical protein